MRSIHDASFNTHPNLSHSAALTTAAAAHHRPPAMASTRGGGGCARCRDSDPAAEGTETGSTCRQCGRALADSRSGCSSPLTVPAAPSTAPPGPGRPGRVMTRLRKQALERPSGVVRGRGRRAIFKKSVSGGLCVVHCCHCQ